MANKFNDGGAPANARKVSIYSVSGADASNCSQYATPKGIYVLENATFHRPNYVSKRYDETRAPNGAVGTDDFVEGSATAQRAFGGTVELDTGDAFTTARNGSTGPVYEAFVIVDVDSPETQGEIQKQGIRYQKLCNTPSVNWPPHYP